MKNHQRIIRTYQELITIPTFEERYEYLKLNGRIGDATFGNARYLNQQFYTSEEWRRIRNEIILRDGGHDLAMWDREITGRIYIHHMNPITVEDIICHSDYLLNPDYLICVSKLTHDAIHYGDKSLLQEDYVERKPYDTCPWRQ